MILPLTLEEIKSIHDAYTAFISKNGSNVDLNSIASKVEEGIKSIREKTGNDCKVFTRLSSRSPKGGLISEKKITLVQIFRQRCQMLSTFFLVKSALQSDLALWQYGLWSFQMGDTKS